MSGIAKAMPRVPYGADDVVAYSQSSYRSSECITVAAVSSLPLPYLEHVHNRCRVMLGSKAYLHWYAKYMPDAADVLYDACYDLYDMCKMYKYYFRNNKN